MNAATVDGGFNDWTPSQLPNLTGNRYLITGGNSGIGLEAAKMLANAGADIVIGCRNPAKAQQAVAEIDTLGAGSTDSVTLDLSSLASVRTAAAEIHERYSKLDGLINNAGIMQTPQTTTVDGFELQLATNHLGHFLLAGLLMDLLENASGRIVVVSSIAHRFGEIHFDDLMLTENYSPMSAYSQSKLANLMFAIELDRRLRASGSSVSVIPCHPGYSATHLQSTGPKGFANVFYKLTNRLMAQPAYNGAIPTVLAAAGKEAIPGAYYGPQSMGEARGRVSDAKVAKRAQDDVAGARLWRESEKLVEHEWAFARSRAA